MAVHQGQQAEEVVLIHLGGAHVLEPALLQDPSDLLLELGSSLFPVLADRGGGSGVLVLVYSGWERWWWLWLAGCKMVVLLLLVVTVQSS